MPSPISITLFVHTDTASDGATFFPHRNFFSSSLFLFLYGAFARLMAMATPLPGLSDNWTCKTWCQPHTPLPFSAVVASFACSFILRFVIRSYLILQPFKTQRQQFRILRELQPNTGEHSVSTSRIDIPSCLLKILTAFAVWWQAGTVQCSCHLYCGIKIVLIGDRKSVAVPCSAMLFLVIMRVL